MTNQNEIAVSQGQANVLAPEVVSESENYVVKRTQDGKFKREAKYHAYSSIQPETKEDRMFLMNILDGDAEDGNGLSEFVGKEIEIADVILNPYDRINEDTGEEEYGVLTYLITPEREVYVTSSKTVYFKIQSIFQWLGQPDDENWENVKVVVTSKKGQNGPIIGIKPVL